MSNFDVELKYWLGFNLVVGVGAAKLQSLLDYFGRPSAAWAAPEAMLEKLGMDKRTRRSFCRTRDKINLDRELEKVYDAGVSLLTWEMDDYPKYLREIPSPPPLLYVRGELQPHDWRAVAVVGTRRLTSYGRQMTHDIAADLARSGITLVSGLARGIDSIAHETAVAQGGRTIAVLGSGLNHIYPPENRALAQKILDQKQGAIISEYSLDTKPQGKNFPPRNRIISGMSLGTVVVEGGKKSGSLITADYALEQNREVFAVPGYITSPASEGPNLLIQQGAKLVTGVNDILEELRLTKAVEQTAVQMALPESAEEAALLPHLSREPRHVDDICRDAGLPSAMVSSTLTLMELKGMVQHLGGMNYALI